MPAEEWDQLDTVDVWRSKPSFPPGKWKDPGKAKIKLMSVPWDAKYEHVVDWKSEHDRDEWFESQDGYVWEDSTGWNFKSLEVWKAGMGKHEGTISVDLPYEAALNYNYLAVELYEQPVPGGEGNRREVYFYFLTSLNKISPSTTTLYLELDTWTVYRNSVNFEAINLERGHHFLSKTSAAKFLSNPLENNLGVTAPEPDLPALKPKVSYTQLVSYSKSSPRVCIATTGDFQNLRSWFTVVPKTANENPDSRPVAWPEASTPGEMSAYWNKSFNKGRGNYNAFDSVGLKTSVANHKIGRGTPEGLRVYSMDPVEFNEFINWAKQNALQVIESIKAIYVLDSAVISESTEVTQWGYTFKQVNQTSSPKLLEELGITKAMFGYEANAADYAKLYTSQFATIEVSNSQGGKAEIAIEEIAKTLSFYSRASSLFPFLKLEALIDGVGGSGVKSYAVKPLQEVSAKIFGSQWENFVFDLDVPIYSIYVDKAQEVGQKEIAARDNAARAAAAEKVIADEMTDLSWRLSLRDRIAWHYATDNSIKSDRTTQTAAMNLAYANAMRLIDLEETNTNRDIDTAYDNAGLSIDVDDSNTTADLSKNKANAERIASNTKVTAEDSAEVAARVAGKTAEINNSNAKLSAELPYKLWFDTERETARIAFRDKQKNLMDNFDDVWRNNTNLYNVSKNIAISSEAMGVMTSANLAAYGALGSGLNSIPAADLGGMIGSGGKGARASMGGAGLGAVAGVAVLDSIKSFFNVKEINEQIWNLQAASSFMLHGEGGTYAVINPVDKDREPVIYSGPGLKETEFNHSLDNDLAGYVMQLANEQVDYDAGVTIRDNAETLSKQYAETLADRSYAVETANIADNYNVVLGNILKNNLVSIANYNADYSVGSANLQRRIAKDEAIRESVKLKDSVNLEDKLDTDRAIAEATKATTTANIDTAIDRYRVNSLNENYEQKTNNAEDSQSTGKLSNSVDLGLKQAAWTAEFLRSVQGAPSSIGEASGKAETDVWGQRGLVVSVRRCTDSTAKQAAGIFSRYGYMADGTMVEDINLSVMTAFSYWKGSGLWITGDRVNETNKEIFRRAFERGITVWSSPTLIFNVKLSENKTVGA